MRLKTVFGAVALCTMGLMQVHAGALPNEIVLEGSDATAFHHDAVYTGQLFTYLQNGSSLPVLVLGGVSIDDADGAGQFVLDPTYSLTGYTLSNYSAVYIESVSGCCTQADTSISAGDAALIAAAEALGLNLSIENYGGGPAWGVILPAALDALPSSDFGGITDFGTAGGPTCTDNEVVNALGLSKGFIQPPVLGCYEHQGYKTSAIVGLGLGFASLFNADPAFFGADGSALIGEGTIVASTTPEPASMLLMGAGLAGLGFIARRRKNRKNA